MKIIASNPNGITVRYKSGNVNLKARIDGSLPTEFEDSVAEAILADNPKLVSRYEKAKPEKTTSSDDKE